VVLVMLVASGEFVYGDSLSQWNRCTYFTLIICVLDRILARLSFLEVVNPT
jgi:hypothetical protein